MPGDESLITPEARALIGRERTVTLGEISLRDSQRYAASVQDDSPRYLDEALAHDTAYGGLIIPPNYLTAIISWGGGPDEEQLGPDGLARTDEDRLPLRVSRVMGGGQELEFHAPMRPGDSYTRTDRVIDISEREGRSGPLVVVVREQTYHNQHGEVVVVCHTTTLVH